MAKKIKDKDLDLLVLYRKKEQSGAGKGAAIKLAAFPLGAALVLAGVFGAVTLRTLQINQAARGITDYLNSAEVQQAYAQSGEYNAQLGKYTARLRLVEDAQKALKGYPLLDGAVFSGLSAALGTAVTIDSYSYSAADGSLILQLVGHDAIQAPDLIDALKQTGLFDRVSYAGYSGDGQTYRMQVICMIKAGDEGE